MESQVIIGIVIAIIAVVAVLYGVGFFMRRKNQEKLNDLEKRKEELFDLPVIEEVDEVKKMHLVGQSQNTFREWSQKWTDLSTASFAELESQIFEVENLNETFRFLKGQAAVKDAEETLVMMEEEVKAIRQGLKELRESEERNSLQVQQALDVYEELKKNLREEGATYGPAYAELQKQVKNIEIEFTQFVTLNTSGDPVEAREVLEEAEKHTYELQDLMKRIPVVYEELNKTFPAQLKEIEDGYKKLLEEKFKFPEENFENDIHRVARRIENSTADLAKVEVAAVEVANRDTAHEIDTLYTVMEREIDAKKYVLKNRQVIEEYINHSMKNNRQLLIEIDHTSQSYTLNHNELGRVRGFQTEIDELVRRHGIYLPQLESNEIPYSEIQGFYKDAYHILDDIENQQVEIDESLRELRKDEKVAQEKIEAFELQLRNLKRFVEKQRLPGLPGDYLEFFFLTTDRVEELGKSLNKIRINIDEVNKLVAICEEELVILDTRTKELVDAAALTEQLMQYANRYRHSHPEVKAAIEHGLVLFNEEYRYQDALDEIATSLERVEPGAFTRLEGFYFNHRDLV
ncbi:septation ring formation regulator EzrA [Enterococcus aquimarinus]|uniref:Septation ring formation regulator EzrA n=1 Tax=Enterococcus aquimarinus TaxID=328396 RepID=A0A1L8QVP9_9ENTE|nr:septation ring formation regulator EzrA [Enterococcus aquimarinus]MBP7085617.1 septation ring formation regulator EzrA [Enterococcus sp.]MBP8693450.1 septation ring formation regulator EzrA [Enterococcus sp.]MBP9520900.1 septation ring formation regulator EzrA [Enterococcus sp.]MBP9638522.1 septation ring formation regulator EzrA [Enterococcus sp.]OJG11583.1 septation ring formation protein EzrA [Enterococcus aquimarinus]